MDKDPTDYKVSNIERELRKFPIVVIAENIHSPSNVGLLLRTSESFGVDTIFFSGLYSNVNSEKFRKASRSSENYINIQKAEDTISVIQGLKAQQYEIIGLENINGSESIDYFFPNSENIALIVGSERHGINKRTLKLCDRIFHIRQYGRTGSLNVGTACSIALYEITNKLKINEKK